MSPHKPVAPHVFDEDSFSAELALLRVEFAKTLDERVDRMRSDLDALGSGYDPEAAANLFRAAHSLKGTAPALDGEAVGELASTLAAEVKKWQARGSVADGELAEARKTFAQLEKEVAAYRSRFLEAP